MGRMNDDRRDGGSGPWSGGFHLVIVCPELFRSFVNSKQYLLDEYRYTELPVAFSAFTSNKEMECPLVANINILPTWVSTEI